MIKSAQWITASRNIGDICPVFRKKWNNEKQVSRAVLSITARGVYSAELNGALISYPLAPGWTAYNKRLQYQRYDVTDHIKAENELLVYVGKGWFASPMPGWIDSKERRERCSSTLGILAVLEMIYTDGTNEIIRTCDDWEWAESRIRFSEIYDGETFDASLAEEFTENALVFGAPFDNLIPQEGESIVESERVLPKSIIRTPNGETVVDFGQEVTGYVELSLNAKDGDRVILLHGEVLDRDGNFYNANYRLAKARLCFICREGVQTYHPKLTFFGFRYVLLKEFPTEPSKEMFTAVAVHSDIRQTGYIETGSEDINKLISNIFWGQRGNFLDVPTDCPQRDERLGWTGDAQVFVKAASLNFDVERFFRKWLRDLAADQHPDGSVGQVIPDYMPGEPSAAWGDAAVICPWQIYMTYGDRSVLEEQFDSMKGWVDYITSVTKDEGLWTGGTHFGDWLGLDAPSGSYKGSSRDDFIASAFYYYSTCLLNKAGKVIGRDVSEYGQLAEKIKASFRTSFPECHTQTEHVLAIKFGLAEDIGKCAADLAQMIEAEGTQMRTGFVGTPYLLHALSDNGYAEIAYSLLLRKGYPSWLYSVGKGATTIWEHWDGIMENGDFWSTDMNSFNHYAYGSVADWIYEKAAGIQAIESEPGYRKVIIAPLPDKRLGWLRVRLDTRNGKIVSCWRCEKDSVRYEISVDMPAVIIIDGRPVKVNSGKYIFWGKSAEYTDERKTEK